MRTVRPWGLLAQAHTLSISTVRYITQPGTPPLLLFALPTARPLLRKFRIRQLQPLLQRLLFLQTQLQFLLVNLPPSPGARQMQLLAPLPAVGVEQRPRAVRNPPALFRKTLPLL